MESAMKSADLHELSRELTRQCQPHAWITVISVTSPSSSYVGAQAIVKSDGELSGWIGGGCVQSAARAAALRSIASAVPQRLRLSNTKDPSEAVDVRPMACASNGEVELFIQPAAVSPRLRIYGKTPIVRIAAWLAREADFDPLTDEEAADVEALAGSMASATVPTPRTAQTSMPPPAMAPAPPPRTAQTSTPPPAMALAPAPLPQPSDPALARETYALIATQGEGDEAALEAALRSSARAVLVIASRRKAERLRTAMGLRGISKERIDAMHAPAGPDIGAVTPNEIALAAVAGLVALRRGRVDPSSASAAPGVGASAGSDASTGIGASAGSGAGAGIGADTDSGNSIGVGVGVGIGAGSARRVGRSAPVRDAHAVTGYVNPVCGAVVDPARALSSLTMAGQTHYFCCQGCRTEFERDPQKYLEIGAHMREPARTTHE
jgi:xanthine dehydrogenase accessory factor